VARGSARFAALALIVAGGVYFAADLGLLEHRAGRLAVYGAGLAVLFHLTQTVDPAWLLSAGILSTMFSGEWGELGLNASIGPHRVLLAAGVLAVVLRAPPARDRPPLRLGGVHYALAAAAAYAVISAIAAHTLDDRNAQFMLIDQFGVLPFVIFALAPVAFATERQRMILLGSLVAAGAYLSVMAVLEKLKLYGWVVPSYIGDPAVGIHFGRARGPFVEAAQDGLALYGSAVAAAIAFSLWRRPGARALAAAVALLAPVGVLLTVTRGVWVAAVVGTLAGLLATAALRRYVVPVALLGVLGVLAAFAVIPGLARDASARQNDKSPIYERRNTNAAALRMIADKPLLGFGFDRANANLDPYFRLHPDIPLVGAAAGIHNVYLQYAASLGLVGFGLWAFALATAFGGALSARGSPAVDAWRAGLVALLAAWFVVGMFSPAHYAFTTLLVWTWAGLLHGRRAEAPSAVRTWPATTNGHGAGLPWLSPQPR
jgi:O-antigen ligase